MSEKKEMTALEYFKAKARMVKGTEDTTCNISCDECPLSEENNGYGLLCADFEMMHPEEVVSIIQKWAEEHPVKTRMSDFFGKFPDAPRKNDGTPYFCPSAVYGGEYQRCNGAGCYECWNRPLEVKE